MTSQHHGTTAEFAFPLILPLENEYETLKKTRLESYKLSQEDNSLLAYRAV
jgi:hypothetical protein